jgi:hypothetical protein
VSKPSQHTLIVIRSTGFLFLILVSTLFFLFLFLPPHRASRVDYYTQHDPTVWKDNFLSLGLEGEDCVFVNLAAVAGPVAGIKDAMMDVNYKAPVAAAQAASELKFGHWVQSSTQATRAERAGQVCTAHSLLSPLPPLLPQSLVLSLLPSLL